MDLTDFLARNQLTVAEVVNRTGASVRLSPGDVLFVSGSLVEGLGNEKSDLDLFLITSRRDIQFTSLNDVTVVIGQCLVDIRVVQRSAVEELFERFNRWAACPRLPRNAFEFTEDERKLLHRLSSGRPLYGEAEFTELNSRVARKDLARHKLDWAAHLVNAIQVDLAGLRAVGDFHSMLPAAHELLGYTIDVLLASYEKTNPNHKWRVRQLAELPADWERRLPGQRTSLSPVERFMSLYRTPPGDSESAIFNHALRIVAFSRCVLPCAEFTLLGHPTLRALALDACAPSATPEARDPLPHLDLDVAIRYSGSDFELLRLNEQGQSATLSPQAFLLLCLFDGVTSRAAAEEYAGRLGFEESGAEVVERLLTLIRYARLGAGEVIDEQMLGAILGRYALKRDSRMP